MNTGGRQKCLFCPQCLPNNGLAIHLGRVHQDELLRAVNTGDIYIALNGGREEVLHVGRLFEPKLGPDERLTNTIMVVTKSVDDRPQYAAGTILVRKMVSFLERFEIDGRLVPRFTLVRARPTGRKLRKIISN